MNHTRLHGDITEDTVEILHLDKPIGTLTQRMNDCCEVEYVFRIDWEAYDALDTEDTVPGLNMDLRLEEYVRFGSCCFMTDFLPPKGRGDIPEIIKQYNLPYYDQWEFMKVQGRICRDNWRVRPLIK